MLIRGVVAGVAVLIAPFSGWCEVQHEWTQAVGGGCTAISDSIATDLDGNSAFIGYFSGSGDFDPSLGTQFLSSAGANDVFVTKLDSSGNWAWTDQFGGSGEDIGRGVAVDETGNIYIVGSFSVTADFDPSATTSDLTSAGGADAFIVKLAPDGSLVWAKAVGGGGEDIGVGIEVDGAGNVYATGFFEGSADFDPGAGTFTLTSVGGRDVFLEKLDSSGNFIWADQFGGSGEDWGVDIAIDSSANILLMGFFNNTADFDPGAGVFNLTSSGGRDQFIVQIAPAGGLVWAVQTDSNETFGVGVDSRDNVYVSGGFSIYKFDSDGSPVWTRQFTGGGGGRAQDVAVDYDGSILASGRFSGTVNFDPGQSDFSLTSAGGDDAFAVKLYSDGSFAWAVRLGGGGDDKGEDGAINGVGGTWTLGHFNATADFDPGPGTVELTPTGGFNVFVTKLIDDTCSYRSLFDSEWPLLAADLGLQDNQTNTPGEGIPERWGIAAVRTVLCNVNHPQHAATLTAYNNNVLALENESAPIAAQVDPYKHVLAAILLLNQAHQDYFAALLALANSYEIVLDNSKTGSSEIFSDTGDLDNDGTINITEYNNIVAEGGFIDLLLRDGVTPEPLLSVPAASKKGELATLLLLLAVSLAFFARNNRTGHSYTGAIP